MTTWHDRVDQFVAVQTSARSGTRSDFASFPADDYIGAMRVVHELRLNSPRHEYAVVDVVYKDGTRGTL